MRQIKFRAWDIYMKRMIFIEQDIKDGILEQCKGWNYMQYTGIKDKNGKEIYEGDILKIIYNKKEYIFKVYFKDGGFFLDTKELGQYGANHLIGNGVLIDCEVIGNIYENKELLQ